MKRRAIHRARFFVAPGPERAQERRRKPAQFAAAGDAPEGVQFPLAHDARGFDGFLTRLLEPFPAPEATEFPLEFGGQRLQISCVIAGILRHLRRKRPPGPVGFLGALGEDNPEVAVQQGRQAELETADEPRRDHGVEHAAGLDHADAAQEPQVVVEPLDDEFMPGEFLKQRLQGKPGQRVDEHIESRHADLDQTQLFEIAMEAVGLGVERDAPGLAHRLQEFR